MRLTTEQLARMSRLLDEIIDADEEARERWLRDLPEEHRDLEPALRRGLFPALPATQPDTVEQWLDVGVRAVTPPGAGLQPGSVIGPYRLVRPLGAGGMAEVWLAERADGAFRRDVALKVPVLLNRREDLARRFEIERDILAALEHPRIARFYDAGVGDDGTPYLALEYVAGRNLLQWAQARQLDARARIELMLQVLEAVEYAHGKGVLHRDIKPGNVLVNDAGQATLLDFGVARMLQQPDDPELTKVYGRALTPAYASPELLAGEPLGVASDIYSLGVVLHELLTGRRPTATNVAASGAVQVEPARAPRTLDAELDAIVRKATAAAPADRYASAAALGADLRRYLAGAPVHALPSSAGYRARKFVDRHRIGVAVAAMVAVVAVGVAWAVLADADGDAQRAGASPTRWNPEARKLMQQAEVYSNGPFKRDAERAEVLFRQAIALEPADALPWVKLGLLHLKDAQQWWTPAGTGHVLARDAIDTALKLDPNLMAAHAARFRYLVRVEHRWSDARAVLDRMRALDINDGYLLPDCEAYLAAINGQLDEAIKIQRQVVERDPMNATATGTLAFYLLQADRYDDAVALLAHEVQLNPHGAMTHALAGVALALSGRHDDALVAISGERHDGYRQWALAVAHWVAGRRDASDAALKSLAGEFPQAGALHVAQVHALRGQRDAAFEWLERACAARRGGCEFVRIDRFFRELRGDARWRGLLAKMQLGEGA